MNQTQSDFVTPATQHFADFPADGQLDNSTLSTQAIKPTINHDAQTDKHNILGEKIESVQTKEPTVDEKIDVVPVEKYNKLKRKFSELRDVTHSLFANLINVGVLTHNQRMGIIK
jgi:hypothetical protein